MTRRLEVYTEAPSGAVTIDGVYPDTPRGRRDADRRACDLLSAPMVARVRVQSVTRTYQRGGSVR